MYQLLIVDDEKTIRMGLARVVNWSELGFEVAGVAENGEEALRIVQEKPIDVLLTDIQMPEMNGLSLARQALAYHKEMKVVIISGYSSFEYAQQGIELRVEGYILKPIDLRQISEVFTQIKSRLDTERQIAAVLGGTARIEKAAAARMIAALEHDKGDGMEAVIGELAEQLRPFPPESACSAYRRVLKAVAEHFQFPLGHFRLEQEEAQAMDCEQLEKAFRQDIESGMRIAFNLTDQTAAVLCHRAREELLREYQKTSVSLREIAARLNVSYGYLSSIFTKQFGISLKGYLIQVRMEKALELLLKRRYKIYEIALMVGYTNTRYFSDAFRNFYGVSPTQKLETLHQMLPDQEGGGT